MHNKLLRQKILDQIQNWKVKAHDAQMIDDYRRSKEERAAALEQVRFWEKELAALDEVQQ